MSESLKVQVTLRVLIWKTLPQLSPFSVFSHCVLYVKHLWCYPLKRPWFSGSRERCFLVWRRLSISAARSRVTDRPSTSRSMFIPCLWSPIMSSKQNKIGNVSSWNEFSLQGDLRGGMRSRAHINRSQLWFWTSVRMPPERLGEMAPRQTLDVLESCTRSPGVELEELWIRSNLTGSKGFKKKKKGEAHQTLKKTGPLEEWATRGATLVS